MKNKQKIIIDCDPGIDDALALVLLVKSKLFEIAAVTTVAGNKGVQLTTNNARFILDQLGRFDIPVFSGSGKPIVKRLVTANVQGKFGLGNIKAKKMRLGGNADTKINALLENYPGQITILALGPLTNIATLLLKYPAAEELINNIVIICGALKVT